MYAIFHDGNKQHKVIKGQIIRLEKLNIIAGEIIEFNKILLISDNNNIKIGNPFIDGSKVIARAITHGRAKKIIIIKFHRRKHFRKHQGHRQWFTDVNIINILF